MNKVFKYEVPIEDHFTLSLPRHAKILAFQAQYNIPMIWALVDPEEKVETDREFRLVGTGHPIEERDCDLEHIGTAQMHMGNLVLQLFEIHRF